jgi:DNA-binding CsgD family transcriptional regulator
MAKPKKGVRKSKKTAKKRRRSSIPGRRARGYRLSNAEQTIIKRMTAAGATMRQIAKKIGRAPSTIWRWQHA